MVQKTQGQQVSDMIKYCLVCIAYFVLLKGATYNFNWLLAMATFVGHIHNICKSS